MQEKELKKKHIVFYEILERIEKLAIPYHLEVHLKNWIKPDVNQKDLANQIKQQILDQISEKFKKKTIQFDRSEFKAKVVLRGDSKVSSGKVIAIGYPLSDGHLPTWLVKNALEKKGQKYKFTKTQDTPFVVAICGPDMLHVNDRNVETAMYGFDMITWNPDDPTQESRWSKDQSGLITPKTRIAPRYTRVSAVLYCAIDYNNVLENGRIEYDMRVYHNPWAKNKLSPEIFKMLPQYIVKESSSDKISLGWSKDNAENLRVFFN